MVLFQCVHLGISTFLSKNPHGGAPDPSSNGCATLIVVAWVDVEMRISEVHSKSSTVVLTFFSSLHPTLLTVPFPTFGTFPHGLFFTHVQTFPGNAFSEFDGFAFGIRRGNPPRNEEDLHERNGACSQ